jgi:hypothetical protein
MLALGGGRRMSSSLKFALDDMITRSPVLNVPRRWRPAWKFSRFLVLGALSGALLVTAEALPHGGLHPASAQQTEPQLAPNCPLPVNVAITFLESKCTRKVLTQPQTFYRHFSSDSNRYGRYLTTDRFAVNTDVIRGLPLTRQTRHGFPRH